VHVICDGIRANNLTRTRSARMHSCSQLLKYGKRALEYGKFLMGIPLVAEAKIMVAGHEAESEGEEVSMPIIPPKVP
jgi:hypothetical protein